MQILAELNRRNIFRVALLYIVASWLLLQTCDLLFGLVGIPPWAYRLMFALLLICFPLVLAFSWVFEITPGGLKREQAIATQESITDRTGQKLIRISIILALIAIPLAGVNYLMSDSTPDQSQLTSESIVVQNIDLQGHRGARGLMPENTIPGFLLALDAEH